MRQMVAVILLGTFMCATEFSLAGAPPPDPAGVVKNSSGSVEIIRQGHTIKAKPNTIVLEGDVIQTGFFGRAGLVMQDDTVISMGHRSRLVLDEYAYVPDAGKFSLVLRILRGTILYISGRIAKYAPQAVDIQTPHAVIGVRGSEILVEVN